MNNNKQTAIAEITDGLSIERRLDGTVSINISEMLFRKIESALSESAGALAVIRASASKEKPVQRPNLPLSAPQQDVVKPMPTPTSPSSQYLTTKDVCEMFQVSRPTVWRWVHEQGFPRKKAGGVIRFPADKVREWLEKRTTGS